MAEAGGLTLPPKNEDLKKQEEAALHGKDLTLNLNFEDGKRECMKVKNSTEVGYVKLMLSQTCKVPVKNIAFHFKGKLMIDPMSFCDHQGVDTNEISIEVRFHEN